MTEAELQQARAELIRGISINQMIDDLNGKTYGQLVLRHLQGQPSNLPGGIAASLALATPDERAASESIIDQYNLRGYDTAFWATDAGEMLASVSCDLNDELFPATAEEAGVFNLFQLITLNFALMAHQQKPLHDFIAAAPKRPTLPQASDHGTITKMLGIAVSDHDAGRITRDHLISIFQAAIDNGDILLDDNKLYYVAAVLPLLDAGVLSPSKHTREFERRMNAEMVAHAATLKKPQPKNCGCLVLLAFLPLTYWVYVLLNRNA